MSSRKFLFIYALTFKQNVRVMCLWNNETLDLPVLLTFTEGAVSTDVWNQKKNRHRLTSQSLSVPAFWAKNRGNKAGHRAALWVSQVESMQQPDEVYLTDLTIKSKVWLASQPEAVTLAKGSLIIIIIAGLFISPPCCAVLSAPALFHSYFFIQPASLYKWCSVLPKS